jgi:hypothetical protein
VGGVDTGVDDVDTSSGSSGRVVSVRRSTLADMRDTAETPGGGALGDVGALLDGAEVCLDDGILLNVINLEKSVREIRYRD